MSTLMNSILTSEGLKAKSLTITTTHWSNYCGYFFSNWLDKKVDLVKISSPHEVLDSCWSLISSWNLNLISLAGTWHYLVALMAPGMTRWLCRLLCLLNQRWGWSFTGSRARESPQSPPSPDFNTEAARSNSIWGDLLLSGSSSTTSTTTWWESRHVWEEIFAVEVGTTTNRAAGELPRPWRRMPRIS